MSFEGAKRHQPAAPAVRNADHGHGHDGGMLHAAQLEQERSSRTHTKPSAGDLSGEAMNDALLRAAIALRGALKKSEGSLRSSGTQVSIYESNIESERADLDAVNEKLSSDRVTGHAARRLENQADEHALNLRNAREEKSTLIARVRDTVFEPLLEKPVFELQNIAAEAQYFGWSDDQHARVSAGVNQLRTMVTQVHGLAKNLELASSPGLKALEKALDDIVVSMKVTVGDADPSELDKINPYELTKKAVADNLHAAEAQAKNALAAVRSWTHHDKSANFARVQGSVQAVEWHIRDAVDLLKELKPEDRHQFKSLLHGVASQVKAVYDVGHIKKSGAAPAGSASMEIDSFPHFIDELKAAIGS